MAVAHHHPKRASVLSATKVDEAIYAYQIRRRVKRLTIEQLYEVWRYHKLAAHVLAEELRVRRQEGA